jgi:amphiphysin
MIQNTLLAQYYTTLHRYCEEEGFPSPPPPMTEVIAQWNSAFKPVQLDVESINTIARGKVVHTSMQLGDDPNRRTASVTGLNIRNNASSTLSSRRGTSPNMITSSKSPTMRPENRVMRIPSSNSIPSIRSQEFEEQGLEAEPRRDEHLSPGYSSQLSHSPGGPTRDYFARDRQASGGSVSPGALSAAGKKKPPPPPPKRINSAKPDIWVRAIYGFQGQEAGDLSFKEGDKIKVIKRTESTDDWWDGEIRGLKGRFPANYCESAS